MIRPIISPINNPPPSPRIDITEEVSTISTNLAHFCSIHDCLNRNGKTESQKPQIIDTASKAAERLIQKGTAEKNQNCLNRNGKTESQKPQIIDTASKAAERLIQKGTPEKNQKQLFEELKSLLPGFLDYYEQTHHTTDPNQLPSRDFWKVLYKDLQAAKISSCSISAFGLNGPTLIVNLLRDNGQPPEKWVKRFVVKWSPQSEFESTIALRALLSITNNAFCRVPPACFLDLQKRQCIEMNGTVRALSDERFQKIESNFAKIRSYNNCSPSNSSSIMLSRKIQGANLHDFILNRYTMLSRSQKESFFEQLGFLSFIDAIVGNLDRLVQISTDFTGFTSSISAPSNLGNVMVRMPKDENSNPIIYAIDNQIHPKTSQKDECKDFIERFKRNGYKQFILGRNVSNSMKGAFTLTGSPFYRELPKEEPSNDSLSDTFVGRLLSGDTSEVSEEVIHSVNIKIFINEIDNFGSKHISKGAESAENALRRIDLNKNLFQNPSSPAALLKERVQTFKQEP